MALLPALQLVIRTAEAQTFAPVFTAQPQAPILGRFPVQLQAGKMALAVFAGCPILDTFFNNFALRPV